MRTITLVISLIFSLHYCAYSQGLRVIYEETITVQLPSNFNQIDNPQIRAAIENSTKNMSRDRSRTAQLLVNNGASVYKTEEQEQQSKETLADKNGNTSVSGTINVQLNSVSPHTIYKNHLDKVVLTQSIVDGKEYLIDEPLIEFKWKIGRKKKEISDFQCIEATTKTANGVLVIAWYTPDIPVSDGPSSYWGLPGLILYLDVNDGMRVFSCKSVEQVNDLPSIDAPDKGEKISKVQYDKIVAEKVRRMQENNRVERGENSIRSSGTTVIRR